MNKMDFDEWEQVKENIQPLKCGRRLNQLAQAMNPKNKEQLDKERQEFEVELRTYRGDDPLDVWIRYINWTEQNFMSVDKNSRLLTLIEKCLAEFHSSPEYQEDPRYIESWMQYAELNPDPYEIFEAMDRKHIGSNYAKFYIRWAWHLEMEHKFKKAKALYKKALERRAQPIADLIEAQEKFELRVAKMSCQQVSEGEKVETDFLPPHPQRRILGDLRVESGGSYKTTSSRAPLDDKENRQQMPKQPSLRRNPMGQLPVLEDRRQISPFRQPSVPDPQMLQPKAERHLQNHQAAGKWTKNSGAKLHLHKTASQKLPFEIHQDSQPSPLKDEPVHSQDWNVLKSRKQLEKVPLAILDPYNPKIKPMYPEHLMYIGTEEFSFEELKAMEYLARMKEARKSPEEPMLVDSTPATAMGEVVLGPVVSEGQHGPEEDPEDEEFTVFEDLGGGPSPVPEDEEDKENRPPEGTEVQATKHVCSGILVPSVDIPVEPLQLQEEEEEEEMPQEEEEECLATPLEGVTLSTSLHASTTISQP